MVQAGQSLLHSFESEQISRLTLQMIKGCEQKQIPAFRKTGIKKAEMYYKVLTQFTNVDGFTCSTTYVAQSFIQNKCIV